MSQQFLRLHEILDHMTGIIQQYQNKQNVPHKTLGLMEQELLEAKKIVNVFQHENKEIKEMREKLEWVEQEIILLKEKK